MDTFNVAPGSNMPSEGEERLRHILTGSNDGTWDWNIQTGDVHFDQRWLEMLGYEQGDLAPSVDAWKALVHPDDWDRVNHELAAHLAGETPFYSCEHRLWTKDGQWKWILDRGKVVERDNYGQALRAAGTHTDIHLRKQAEIALGESEARYRSLIESQHDLVIRINPRGKLTFANDAFKARFHLKEIFQEELDFSTWIHPDDQTQVYRSFQTIEKPPYRTSLEVRALTAEGWIWTAWEIHAIKDSANKTSEVQVIGRDITLAKEMGDLLVAQRDLAQGLAAVTSVDAALRLCLDTAIRISQMDCGGVYLVDPHSDDLNLVCASGLSEAFIASTRHWPAQSEHARLVKTAQPLYTSYQQLPWSQSDLTTQEDLHALAVLPISNKKRVIGCINLSSHQVDELPHTCRQALETIIAQIGTIIDRVQVEEAWRNSQLEWQALFNSLQDFFFVLDDRGRILHVNNLVIQRLGYKLDELLGNEVLMVHPPELRVEAAAIIGEMVAGRRDLCPLELQTKEGRRIPVETKVTGGSWGGKPALFGVSRDISTRKQAEAELQDANVRLTARLDELNQRNHQVVLLNEMGGLLQVCARPEEAYEVIYRQVMQLFPRLNGALYITSLENHYLEACLSWGQQDSTQKIINSQDCWALRRGRSHMALAGAASLFCPHIKPPLPASSLCVPIMALGETMGIFHIHDTGAALSEATQQLAQTVADTVAMSLSNLNLRETLRQQSIRDPLTRLYNRRYMEEMLSMELARAERAQTSLSILVLDIDHFKKFNDTYGHQAGDAVLCQLAELLQSNVRKGDIACRFGGEEFVLVLPNTPRETALQRAEVIRRIVKESHLNHHNQYLGQMTISQGVALYPLNGTTSESLLHAADLALYAAKQEGRDRVCLADQNLADPLLSDQNL